MQKNTAIYEEVINEIGTQTLAKLGLNIFSLNTYGAYEASETTTNIVNDTYQRHKNNPNAFGQYFEDIDVGQKNINSALFNTGEKTYTTDELADIKKHENIINSGKKYDKLNAKDQNKFDFIKNNYGDDIGTVQNSSKEEYAIKNHKSIDTVTFDKDGQVIEKSQHKVTKDTDIFFTKEKEYDSSGSVIKDAEGKPVYKKDENGNYMYKYLKDNDVITVPFDEYKMHKENLENTINHSHKSEDIKNAKEALDMLNKNNMTNRLMCENPRATTIMMQTGVASGHIAQAGLSDAIVVTLSTLANGAIWEIKDAYSSDKEVSIKIRIERLLKKVIEAFKNTFQRGASFGALEIGIELLEQVFRSIFSKIKDIFQSLKKSLKSIYNAIYSYINGEIKSYQQLISTIIKSLLSATIVVGVAAFEASIEAFLAPILTPIVASFVAPAIAIVVGSLALIITMRSVDAALNAIFSVIAQRDLAKIRTKEIEELCLEFLPKLMEERNELEQLIETTYKERRLTFEKSFSDFREGLANNDIDSLISGLIKINDIYGKELQYCNFDEFDTLMHNENEQFKL